MPQTPRRTACRAARLTVGSSAGPPKWWSWSSSIIHSVSVSIIRKPILDLGSGTATAFIQIHRQRPPR